MATTCRHCERDIVLDVFGSWIDPQATGDDILWRETCDANDTFEAYHEPMPKGTIGRAFVELDVARLEASALESDNGDPFVLEVGYRAWTWAHDVNEYEYNDLADIRMMIPELGATAYARAGR